MNKSKIKSVLIIVVLLLVGVLAVLGVNTARTYMAGASGTLQPQNVSVDVDEKGTSATVKFTTASAALPKVEYGTTPASMLLSTLVPETATTDHNVVLTGLKSGGQSYYFRIRIGDELYDNEGIPFSFKTKGSSTNAPVATTPSVVPTVSDKPVMVPTTGATDMSKCVLGVDYDKNGVVNSMDVVFCTKNGGVFNPSKSPASSADPTNPCAFGTDYNKDGAVNSKDIVDCRREKGM